jgi:hypothetical protein
LIFKTNIYINSYTRPLCVTNPEYEDHNQEIWSFSQFLLQTGDFRLNRNIWILSENLHFFKTRKNSYT